MFEAGSSFSETIDYNAVKNLLKGIKRAFPELNDVGIMKSLTLSGKITDRLQSVSQVLNQYLPEDFNTTLKILSKSSFTDFPQEPSASKFVLVACTLIVAQRTTQIGNVPLALEVLKILTKDFSSEFAIRILIKKFPEPVEEIIKTWVEDENIHVRRLVSEGTRPRLPWSFKLDRYIKQPQINFKILTALNRDPSKYVQKSVANHLNDISKDNPKEVINLIKNWDRSHPVTQWIIRHGLRTLIKKGHLETLKLLGFSNKKFTLTIQSIPKKIKIGRSLMLKGLIENLGGPLMVDYGIVYPKKKTKVFKLTTVKSNSLKDFKIKIHFKNLQTRKMNKGPHLLWIQINGEKVFSHEFQLT